MLSIKVSEVILLCEKFSVMHFQYIYFDLIKIFVILSRFLLGPEQVSTCEVPIVFRMKIFFVPNDCIFHCLTHIVYVTPAEKCLNLLSSSISTTRWRYNQGKCTLAYNSHIRCHTFKNLISTCSLNWAEFHHRPRPFPPTVIFHKYTKCCKPTF